MSNPLTPELLWAQRSSSTDATQNLIYLTISVPDVSPSDLKLDLQANSINFSGKSSSLKRDFAAKLEFYAEIDPENSKVNHTSKNIELVLRKKELKEEYWPRLIKEKIKLHFLKTDFDKWVDEDEQNEVPDENMSNIGGMGGMPGMGGMGDMSSMMGGAGGDFGGLDFSQLGGGMDEDDADEHDDDEMPELEGDDEKDISDETKSSAPAESSVPAEASGKAKIQEVS